MIYSIATQKGGTGKTTTSLSVSANLARTYHKKILLVDMDSQANSSKILLGTYKELQPAGTIYRTIIRREPLSIYPSSIPGVDIAPAHIFLSDTDTQLAGATDHREERLKKELDKVKDRYDCIFIDCPPSLGWLTLNSLTASDQVIIVVEPGYFELDSIQQIMRTINQVQTDFNPSLVLRGILMNKSDSTTATASAIATLKKAYAHLFLTTIIPRNTDIKTAQLNHQDIYSYNPKAYAAIAYEKLVKELFL